MASIFALSAEQRQDAQLKFDCVSGKVIREKSWVRKIYRRIRGSYGYRGFVSVTPEPHQRLRVRFDDGQFETIALTGEQTGAERGDQLTLLWASPAASESAWELVGVHNHTTGEQQALSRGHIMRATPAYGSAMAQALGAGVFAALLVLGIGEMPSDGAFWFISLGTAFCIGALRMGALSMRVSHQVKAQLAKVAAGAA